MDVVGAVLLIHGERVKHEPGKTPLVAARLGEHRHIGRQLAAERGAGRLVVGERRREMIGQRTGPLEHLALVVGAVGDLEIGRDRACLRLGEAGAARLGEIAERQQFYAVAGRADFLVDLEAALQLGLDRRCRTDLRTTIFAAAARPRPQPFARRPRQATRRARGR